MVCIELSNTYGRKPHPKWQLGSFVMHHKTWSHVLQDDLKQDYQGSAKQNMILIELKICQNKLLFPKKN